MKSLAQSNFFFASAAMSEFQASLGPVADRLLHHNHGFRAAVGRLKRRLFFQ
jgi:hypothetical protein